MTRAETQTRLIMGRYPKLPRKMKKRYRNAVKVFVQTEMISGNWDLTDYIRTDSADPPIVLKDWSD